jgi:hypothetical protein
MLITNALTNYTVDEGYRYRHITRTMLPYFIVAARKQNTPSLNGMYFPAGD